MRALVVVFLVIVMTAATGCLPMSSLPVRIDMPGVRPFSDGLFEEILVAKFRDEAPSPEFELGRELQAYLATELGRPFDGKVSILDVPADSGASLDDPGFWKQAAAGRDKAVVIAGTASLVAQTRKALHKNKLPVDGPFKIEDRGLVEYRHYTLSVDLVIISAETGAPLFRKSFREEKDYIDVEKPIDFAFSDLADRVRARLLPLVIGTSTIEERTLLRH